MVLSRCKSFPLLVPAFLLLFQSTRAIEEQPENTDRDLVQKIDRSLERAVQWVVSQQNPDGGFGPSPNPRLQGASDPGITAFVTYGLARAAQENDKAAHAALEKAVVFLLSRQQPDGSFYDPRDPSLQNYKTSVTVLALASLDRVKYGEVIQKAQKFIKSQQLFEDTGHVRGSRLEYGGIGYGSHRGKPDMSNTMFAVSALRASGLSASDSVYERVQVFLSRCQNASQDDPLRRRQVGIRTTGDGGCFYSPYSTRGREITLGDGSKAFSSYGSMTYAGLLSFVYAYVDRDDERVKAAFDWVRKNFTVTENPGMAAPTDPLTGRQGLFYYYHTMAKALSVYGERFVVDGRGARHDWPGELSSHLVKIQHVDGYWRNDADRWWESLPALATSYAMVALTYSRAEIAGSRQASASSPEPSPSRPTPVTDKERKGK